MSLVRLRLDGDRAERIFLQQGDRTEEKAPIQASAACELDRLARSHPDAWIVWYDRRLEPWLSDPSSWPGLARHSLEVLHLGCFQRTDLMAGSLGLVDFESPWLLPGPRDRRFATWLISPAAGMASAAAIRAVAPDCSGSLAAFLFELGVRGVRHGLSPCSEPALLANAVPEQLWDRTPLTDDDLARLIRRGYGRKWVGFWVFARLTSERQLSPATVGAALRAWITEEPGRMDEKTLARLHPLLSEKAPREDVDVIIPTLGRPGPLQDTLADLGAQTFPPRRVIVIAQDSTPKPAGEWPFELIFLFLPTPGACKARNAGLRQVCSPWVLFLDDDVRLGRGLLSSMVRTAHAYGVEAVNALIHLPGQDPQRVSSSPLPRPWPTFGTAAVLVSAAALEMAGGLDERLEGGYGEDYELGVRLRLSGAAVLYAPGEPVLHLKAPAGGFREPFRHPWWDDPVPPRPSPTVLYSRHKHHTKPMRDGYRLFYALKRLSRQPVHTWPREARTISRQWKRALWWAKRMAEMPE